jgi:hypothetical protein
VAKSIFKTILIAMCVLLIGQVRIGSNTVGGHFAKAVADASEWALEELHRVGFFKSISSFPVMGRLVLPPPVPRQTRIARNYDDTEEKKEVPANAREDITTSDRESLMRLLR